VDFVDNRAQGESWNKNDRATAYFRLFIIEEPPKDCGKKPKKRLV